MLRLPGRPAATVLAFLAAALGAGGCATPDEYAAEADEAVYELIAARRDALRSEPGGFRAERAAALRAELEAEVRPRIRLDLVGALEAAADNSREVQDRRERLFLAALDLTLERWRFGWRPTLTGGADVSGTGGAGGDASAEADLGLQRLFGSGAVVIADLGTSLVRALAEGDGWDALSSLSLSITQPLLRGAGREVVTEPLTQAERNLVYEVRSYERFRRTFAVDVIADYYGLLRSQDAIRNEEANLESLRLLRARNEALAEAGKMTDIQVDQARQDELRSENRLLQLQAAYDAQVDRFMVRLGLPPKVELELDPDVIAGLRELDGSDLEGLDATWLQAVAAERRLDYLNTVDRLVDAERRARIAADALRAGLDLEASLGASSEPGRPLAFRSDAAPWSLGLSYDLPVDRLPERNLYRRALVEVEAARRAVEADGDGILQALRDDLRQALSTLAQYRIQRSSVDLAAKRVRSAQLKLEAGRSSTRDVLEAQRDLLSAQNAATSALIDFALARLRLWRDLELLEVDPSGIHLLPLPEPEAPALP